jgi:ketosteroid isomerase-like protein
MSRAPRTHDVLDYALRFQEVKVLGDYAYEWGSITGSMREIVTGDVSRSAFHVMRILRRQADGSWRVYRSIWTRAPE